MTPELEDNEMTDREIAYKCAPVIVQKVNKDNPRGDFITRVDFAKPGDLESLKDNWIAAHAPIKEKNEWRDIQEGRKPPEFEHELKPYVYYSVVETHSHYFILYAIYHPQDWEDESAAWNDGPVWWNSGTEHLHDMEGALVIASKCETVEDLRADAMITISHWWFYTYAHWYMRDLADKEIPVFPMPDRYQGSRVNKENLDGRLWAVWHIDENDREIMRQKLYVQAKGHGIRGDRRDWGGGDRIIHYCPSLMDADEPELFASEDNGTDEAELQHKNRPDDPPDSPDTIRKSEVWRYGLIDIFEPNPDDGPPKGLWASRDKPGVFLLDGRGQDCFAVFKDNNPEAGSAKPPWSWDDRDDAHASGELALQPAHITYNYLGGLREFSLQYIRNPYLGI